MQAGTFNSMNDAISKFIDSCTEATGHSNAVLFYQNQTQRGIHHGRYNTRGRPYYRGGHRYNNSNNNNKGNSRGRGNSNRGQNNNNQGNVRVAQNNLGNSNHPLATQQ